MCVYTCTENQNPYSVDEWPFSSVKTESSSDWSLSRSHGKIEAESANSWTGAMLGLRLPVPFTVGGTSLPTGASGGVVFWRSMATVPVNTSILVHMNLSPKFDRTWSVCFLSHPCWQWCCGQEAVKAHQRVPQQDHPSSPPGWRWRLSFPPWWCWCSSMCL